MQEDLADALRHIFRVGDLLLRKTIEHVYVNVGCNGVSRSVYGKEYVVCMAPSDWPVPWPFAGNLALTIEHGV